MIKFSEDADYTAIKADQAFEEIYEKIIDLAQTDNPVVTVALEKFQMLRQKNQGLKIIIAKGRVIDIDDPNDIAIYSFAPCTERRAILLYTQCLPTE